MTFSEENYLKAIYHLGKDHPDGVTTNAIAEQVASKASSVTDMLKKLNEKQLVDYQPYQGVRLTEKGRHVALGVVRKHRLWEVFLVEKLRFAWDEVHEVAEQLEHISSEKLTEELDRFLGFPAIDPHGDPIPDAQGNVKPSTKKILASLGKGTQGFLVAVKDSSSDFLRYLDKLHIALGARIEVMDLEAYDNSLRIEIDGRELMISEQIANNLYVKPTDHVQ